ncbi:MAG: metallophosphoesterase [Chloroflexota bacterium]
MKRTLRIYALSDIHSPDDFHMPELDPDQFDLVVTLGDIDDGTLDYIIYMAKDVPCIGVPGNHDSHRPAGLNNLHGKMVVVNGVRIAGIGGAKKYKDHPHHYTDAQMKIMMWGLPTADLVISHSPPLATSTKEDPIHQGFSSFDRYIEKHQPQVWIHGHTGKKFTGNIDNTDVYGVSVRRPLTLEFDLKPKPKVTLKSLIANLLP